MGPDEVPITVHRRLLMKDCAFFAAAFGTNFAEANSGRIAFPNEDVATIEAYVRYLYMRTEVLERGTLALSASTSLKLYGFAERIMHQRLCDLIVDDLEWSWHMPDFRDLVRYWRDAPDSTPMRACLVHKLVDRLAYDDRHAVKALVPRLDPDYFAGVDMPASMTVALHGVYASAHLWCKVMFPPRLGDLAYCSWHSHGLEVGCPKKGRLMEREYSSQGMRPIVEHEWSGDTSNVNSDSDES